MAEIEHFVDPENKNHARFDEVRSTVMTLYPAKRQLTGEGTIRIEIGKAVDEVGIRSFFFPFITPLHPLSFHFRFSLSISVYLFRSICLYVT